MATVETTPEGCQLHRFTVPSPSMERDINAVAVLPQEYDSNPGKQYPILYTFHGMAAPFDTFSAMAPLRAALADKPMIVTCLDADLDSFYLDATRLKPIRRDAAITTPVKSLFTTFFLQEFIPALDAKYRVNPAQRMLTGFSMGGYGALHYMLAAPEKFASVSALSGWFQYMDNVLPHVATVLESILGPRAENRQAYTDQDVFIQLKKQHESGVKIPPLYLACGTEDFLIQPNRNLHAHLEKLGIAHEYIETAGDHNWPYWRDASPGIIDFHWRSIAK